MRRVRRPLCTTAALLALVGCKRAEPDNPRPADAPDVIVLAVSGHCIPLMGLCDGNFNPEYLSHAGTVDELVTPLFEDAGLGVQWAAYVDGWYTWVDTDDQPLALGFVDLVGTLETAWTDWIDGFDNPTRVVVVGHGHGVVWTHLAAEALPDLPIDVMIDLDGVSAGWDDDESYFGVGDDWPTEIPGFISEGERTWSIDRWRAQEDIVPANVVLDLEVHSTPTPFQESSDVFDAEPNQRADGSTKGIRTCSSQMEHYLVYEPGTDCMEWVVQETLSALR